MGRMEKQLRALIEVGDVGFYKTDPKAGGGYGISLAFYDGSYYLAHPSDTIKGAIKEMSDEWIVKSAQLNPAWLKMSYQKKLDKEEEEYYDQQYEV